MNCKNKCEHSDLWSIIMVYSFVMWLIFNKSNDEIYEKLELMQKCETMQEINKEVKK